MPLATVSLSARFCIHIVYVFGYSFPLAESSRLAGNFDLLSWV
uniref:Uncharacterized protein n=1 Tax=Rhizophora mucronata TaxID=61149 RepID=A0A2P2LVM0_RHIMU